MADIGEAIYARLQAVSAVTALIKTRSFPLTPIDSAERPYLTYHLISMSARPHAMGADPALVHDRYQFDLFADTYSDVVALDDAVMSALSRYRGTSAGVVIQDILHIDRRDIYEREPKLYRRSLDFEIHWEE